MAGLYPNGKLVMAGDASRETIMKLLPRYSAFHFAGHAISDVDRPEFSYLALAPDSTNNGGILRAREIGNLRLSNLSLVILAACSTLNPRATRVGNSAGLAHSFLRAGVPSIVSSIWDVGDAATAELLLDFHKRYAVTGDAAEALRFAQLKALKSDQIERRAIQSWAAFIYTGN